MTRTIPIPPQQDLEQMYLVDQKSTSFIADKYGCHRTTVSSWLRDYDIVVHQGRPLSLPPKTELEQMYLTDKKSSCYIADKYNCNQNTVLKWLHMYKIPVRPHYKKWNIPPKEILDELYIDRHLSTTKIGEMYDVTSATVLKLLRHYEIEVRRRGQTKDKRIVCDILKKHADDLNDDPERLSTEFMQNLLGVQCDDITTNRR